MKTNKLLLLLSLVSVIGVSSSCSNSNTNIKDVEKATLVGGLNEDFAAVDFSSGEISFKMDRAIEQSINTFEASLRLPTNFSAWGVIFSSHNSYNAQASYKNNYISYEVNANGHPLVKWAGVTATFDMINLRLNKWVHLAITRNSATQFSAYIDGVLTQTVEVANTKDITANQYCFRIGSSTEDNSTTYLQGEIGSITCYRDVLTADEIANDFTNIYNINYANRGLDLQFHTLVELGKDVLKDTSNNCNNARVWTSDFYYDAPHYEIEENSYSFGVVGDTQELSRFHKEAIDDYSYWAIDNKERTKLQAMLYMGDLSDGMSNSSQEELEYMWTNVSESMKVMDDKVPYVFVPGNHDYKQDSYYRDLTMMNQYYPYSHYSQFPYFGGAYEEGQIQNTYYLFEAEGVKYIVLALGFGPVASVMNWVSDVLEEYSDHRAIVITHGFLSAGGEVMTASDYLSPTWYFSRKGGSATNPDEMWNDYLSYHDNVFMILCGHTSTEYIAYKELKGRQGNTTMVFRVDPSYILAGNSGNGFDPLLALFNINEATSTLSINMFSLEKNLLYNTQNQMRINFDTYTRYTHSYYNLGKEIKASL